MEKKYFIFIIIILIISFFVIKGINTFKYNDGVCKNCGGEYELVDTIYARQVTEIYKCKDCNKVIHLTW